MKIVSGKDMAAIDKWVIEERGIPQLLLMENAGRAAAAAAWKYLSTEKNQAVIIAGKGNNGGDGLVAARHLHQWGADVRLFLLCNPEEYQGTARENWGFIEGADIRWYVLKDKNSFYPLKLCLETAAVAVDAILGVGFRGSLEENYLQAVEALNQGSARVLSVDIPSGIDPDSGQAASEAVLAGETVAFAYGKQGLYQYPGRKHAGIVSVVDISVPKEAIEILGQTTEWVDAGYAGALLPSIQEDSHKGSFGHVVSVAGSRGMTGAALLAAKSVLRGGAGLVTTAAPDSLADGFDLAFPEGMTAALTEDSPGRLSPQAGSEILAIAKDTDVLLFGPGLARDASLPEILQQVLAAWEKPTVLDAGGLWALAQNKDIAISAAGPLVLTPHPGEMGMLLDVTTQEVQRDRCAAVCKAAREYGAVVVLKGASTLVADPEGMLYINSTGNPALATAGSGDVLAGALAAFIAQGLPPCDAAVLAVFLHGLAGDMLKETKGGRGCLAGEIADFLPLAAKEMRDGNKRQI
ncbi:MAG: NAD(P)H-hydrate dehydratase [Clostridiales bacterium]|nr:NAD(P)H-hydrate dehydratase [Clostridiales bacterium]